MTSGAEPIRVKRAVRDHLREIITKQILGSAATLAVACRMDGEQIEALPDTLMVTLDHHMRYDGTAFAEKLGRAASRYFFLD
jgi:hypothetical protein